MGFVDQNWREAWRSAIYEDGAATSTFTFAYTVKATDVDNNGVRIVPGTNTTGFGGGGNIVSVADNTPSSDWYEGSWHLTSHKVNGQPSVGGGAAFDLDDANDGAWDVWVGSEMVLVVDQGENKIFAYDDGGRREPSRDIDLDQSGGDGAPEVGTTPTGIWSEGETVWVAFQDRNNIFAYNLADGTRNADKEIPLEGAGLGGQHRSLGIWSDGTTMWVMNSTPFKILAFDLESKTYDSGKTFTPPQPAGAPYSGGEVTDLWSDGTTVWLPDSAEGKLYAHRLNDGSQDSDKDISVTLPQDQNGISGVSVSGNHMWVVSRDSDDTTFNLTKYNVPSLIDTSPFLSGVRVISTPEDGETYTSGGLIEIDVTFSHPVRLFGRYDPGLLLMVGDPRLVDPVRPAYLDRSDQDTYDDPTGKLKFIYRVQDGDYSPDGVNINRRRLDRLTEDAILGSDGEVSVRDNYQGLVVKRGHPVDARAGVTSIKVASTPASPGGYRVGEVIKIELAYAVPVEAGEDAAIYLQLNEARDNRLKGATYSAGNGTDTLTFSYTVKAGDVDTDGLTIVGSVGDAVGQEREIFVQGRTGLALREYEFQNNIAGQSVDGLSNAIQTEIISTPELGDAYGPGEEILVKITFDQDIGFEVGPILQLEIGDHVRQVTVDPEQRSYDIDHLLFPYTVQDSDHDSDGIVILSQFVSESDRYLYDAGSSTGITVEAIPSGGEVQTGHKVLLPATIQSIDLLSDPGGDKNYIIGDRVEVGVTFDQAMTVTGTPSLGFETTDRYGETEVLMEYDRTAGEGDQEGTIVVFAYTVAEGDSADEGIYIPGNAFRLDEGDSLTGPEGNPANLDHEIFNHPDSHFIDATRPTFGSAETSTLGKEVRVRFSETVGVPPLLSRVSQMIGLDLGVFYAAVLDVTVDGKPVIPGAASISDNTLTLGMPDESQIQTGQVVKVSYDNIFALDAPGLFVDSKGNALNRSGPNRSRTVRNITRVATTVA